MDPEEQLENLRKTDSANESNWTSFNSKKAFLSSGNGYRVVLVDLEWNQEYLEN